MNNAHIYEAVIVGSGFSGIGVAIRLKQSGIDNFVILEKAGEVGGTWRENSYPACRCDIKSHLYSYSFEPNSSWSQAYSSWNEIQEYILSVAKKYQLRQHLRFRSEVIRSGFNQGSANWLVECKDGSRYQSHYFVLATGPLHVPNIPNLPGLNQFEGKVMHSAQWDHSYDFKGKHVASIGTGASAIQYAPAIAPEVKQLDVYQRAPPWIFSYSQRNYSKFEKCLFAKVPFLQRLYRYMLFWLHELRIVTLHNPRIAKIFSKLFISQISKEIKDPILREKLIPNYVLGCKRILISNDWYPMFNRDNVDLVTSGIKQIGKDYIESKDGKRRRTNCILLGTGFVTDPRDCMHRSFIIGADGQSLLDRWRSGVEAYLGISVDGFPNFYQMMGPNTGTGHMSVVFFVECQARYIVNAIQYQLKHGLDFCSVKPKVQSKFVDKLQRKLEGTV